MRRLTAILTLLFALWLEGHGMPLENLPSDSLISLGTRMFNASRRDSALMCYATVTQRYYRDTHDASQYRPAVQAFCGTGYIYTLGGQYGKAYECLATGIALAEEMGMKDELVSLYNNMSTLWSVSDIMLGSGPGNRTHYLRRAYRMAVETGNQKVLPILVDNMLVKEQDTAFRAELADFRRRKLEPSPPLTYTRTYLNAHEAMLRGDTAQAATWLRKASEVAAPFSLNGRINALFALSNLHEQRRDLVQSRRILRQIQTLAQQANAPEYLPLVYDALSQNFHLGGMADSAKEYRYKLLEAHEALRRQNDRDLSNIELTQKIDKVNQELRQMSLRRQQRERQLIVAVAVGLLLLMAALWAWQSYRNQARHVRELYQQNLKLLKADTLMENEKKDEEPSATSATPPHEDKQPSESCRETYRHILDAMGANPEVYDPDFNLAQLSTLTGIHTRPLTQAISECAGCNVPQFVSEWRIREACRRFNDVENYGHLTIEAIGQSVGLSRSSFHRLFKKVTGLTPAQYRKEASHSS